MYCSKPHPLLVPPDNDVAGRPTKYKTVVGREDKLKKAYNNVESGKLSIRRAAEEYGVPPSTLHDRVSGKVSFSSHSGPPRYLTDKEEIELADFLIGCASIGCARSKQEVLAFVQRVVISKGITVSVSKGWWDSFRKRHPDIVLRSAEPVSKVRLRATHPDIMSKYCQLLECTLEQRCQLSRKFRESH